MEKETYLFENISKHYQDSLGHSVFLLNNISFSVSGGKINALLAPKDSGKSSLLKIIDGLEVADNSFPKNISTVYIPSEPSSFPWLSVIDNIIFGLKTIDDEFIAKCIKLVGLEGYEDHKPDNDSIGFRFRISLARALVRKPDLILLDEPFNHISDYHKIEVYQMIVDLVNKSKQSILLATTNINESLCLAKNIILMKNHPGEIIDTVKVDLNNEIIKNLISSDQLKEKRIEIEEILRQNAAEKLVSYSD